MGFFENSKDEAKSQGPAAGDFYPRRPVLGIGMQVKWGAKALAPLFERMSECE